MKISMWAMKQIYIIKIIKCGFVLLSFNETNSDALILAHIFEAFSNIHI